jgi:hypothetical protein
MNQYHAHHRFHVHLGEKRTTVSLGNTLAHLLALKLGEQPETAEAHSVIKKWLQAQLDENGDPLQVHVSQWLKDQAIEFIVDKKLSEKYDDWILRER